MTSGLVSRQAADRAAAITFVGALIALLALAWSLGAPQASEPVGQTHTSIVQTTEQGAPAANAGTITTETTSTTAPGLLDRLLAPGLVVLLQLGVIALAAFVAAAVTQRVLLGLYDFSLGPLTVPKITRDDVSRAGDEVVEGLRRQTAAGSAVQEVLGQFSANAEIAVAQAGVAIGEPTPALDPNLQLVEFRIELEKQLRALAERFDLPPSGPLGRLVIVLRNRGILDAGIASALSDLIDLGNRAAHGSEVAPEAGAWAQRQGPLLIEALRRYVQEGPDGLAPNPQ